MFNFLTPKDNFQQELSNFIFANSPDAYCVIREGRVIAFNAAFSTIMRQPASELMGLTPPDFSPELQFGGRSSAELAGDYIARAMRDGHCRFEWEVKRRDQSRFPVMVTLMRWKRQDETLLIFVWQDIEEMVRLRDEDKLVQSRNAQAAQEDQFAIDALSDGLKSLAKGDLTRHLETPFAAKTEGLRSNFNLATEQLRKLIEEVKTTASMVLRNCGEIGSSSSDLANRTERQAASIEEASGALSQIVANVSNAAGFASEAKGAVGLAMSDSEKARSVVTKAISAMEDIARSSGEIGKIIGVIDEIAFQTNLLALNAGVEAARAGEAGKGFAVVAQEVRELAQRSAAAAKEIRSLITSSNQQVSTGVNLVCETGDALGRIVTHVGGIDAVVVKIQHSTHEQEASIREIDTVIRQVDQATQQNAAMVEETAAATQTMTDDLNDVARSLAGFKTQIDPRVSHRAAA